MLVTLLRPQLRGGGWGAVRTSQSELGSSGASPQMVGGTRAPSQRQAWGSGSSPVTPCVTSGSGHGISSLSLPILKLGVTSLGQVALGRLFGVRAGGERQTWELPLPPHVLRAVVELSLAGPKAEPAQVAAAGQTCSAHLAWGRAADSFAEGLA